MNIKWIFFDVGSTLVDEAEAYDHRAKEMLENTDIPFSAFDKKRTELARLGFDGNSEAIKYFGLKKTPWHSEDEVPFSDAAITLRVLKNRGYNLGIIANQNEGLEKRLDGYGLLGYFDVIASSSEVGFAKPDRQIFEHALKMADCKAQSSVMVGDRLDNDIIPAKNIGMNTVWIRKGSALYQPTDLGRNSSDWVIENLAELLKIF